MDLGFRMHAERTPNPNSIKWVLGDSLAPDGQSGHFAEPVDAEVSPLAARLFGVKGVQGVFVAANFVTVTKSDQVEWPDIAESVVGAIKEFAGSGESALGPAFEQKTSGADGEVAQRIQQILEREVRPAVAQDGGDIIFAGYQDGRVEVYLQGSCSGCPSSTLTLKMGIEERLRQDIPEIVEVVAL